MDQQAVYDLHRKGAAVSQVALAWVLAQKRWIVPIPGTTKLERLEENLRSVDLEFSSEEWRDLNNAVSKIKLQGVGYPPDAKKGAGTENQFELFFFRRTPLPPLSYRYNPKLMQAVRT